MNTVLCVMARSVRKLHSDAYGEGREREFIALPIARQPMCKLELIVNNEIARTAPITHESLHSMRTSLGRISSHNKGLTAFWRKIYESRPTLTNRLFDCRTPSLDVRCICFILVLMNHN